MKILIKKFMVLLLLYIGISISITTAVYDYDIFSHNDYLKNESRLVNIQINNLKKTKGINTYFLGTSKTFRAVDPIVFDSITGFTKSINLGVNNLLPLRSMDFDKYVSSLDGSVKYIISEIRPIPVIDDKYNYIPYINSITFDKYQKVMSYISCCNHRNGNWRRKNYYDYTMLLLYKYLTVGAFRYWNNVDKAPYFKYSNVPLNGYFPLDREYHDNLSNKDSSGVVQHHFHYLKKRTKIDLDSIYKMPPEDQIPVLESGRMLAKWNLENLKKAFPNARLIFVIPPRTDPFFYQNLYNQKVYYKSQGYEVLDFADSKKFPELYTIESSFEQFHLNEVGAKIYTKLLANFFKNNT